MAVESAIFSQKSPHKFSDTDPSNHIISRFTHFKKPFSPQNQKSTYSTTLKALFTVFQISPYVEGTTLKQLDNILTRYLSYKHESDELRKRKVELERVRLLQHQEQFSTFSILKQIDTELKTIVMPVKPKLARFVDIPKLRNGTGTSKCRRLKCLHLLIMRLDGPVSEN